MRRTIMVHLALLVAITSPARAAAQAAIADVPLIADATLHDIAMTSIVEGRPVIMYNPVYVERVGPVLARFFIMHERGHIASGHTGSALIDPVFTGNVHRLQQELEADCFAAEHLAVNDHDAIDAALDFFQTTGKGRFDALHPTGSQRAAKILACLPGPR